MGGGLSQTKTPIRYTTQNGNTINGSARVKTVIQGPGSNRYGKEYALQFDDEYHDEVNTCVQIATANFKKRAAHKNLIREKVRRNTVQAQESAVRARTWNQHVADIARQAEQAEQSRQARQFRARVNSNFTRRNSKNPLNDQSFPSLSVTPNASNRRPTIRTNTGTSGEVLSTITTVNSLSSKPKPIPIKQNVRQNGNNRRRATLKAVRNALGQPTNSNSD